MKKKKPCLKGVYVNYIVIISFIGIMDQESEIFFNSNLKWGQK